MVHMHFGQSGKRVSRKRFLTGAAFAAGCVAVSATHRLLSQIPTAGAQADELTPQVPAIPRDGTKGWPYLGRFSCEGCFLFLDRRTNPVMGAKNHPRKNHSQALRFVV